MTTHYAQPQEFVFSGSTYEAVKDRERLTTLLQKVHRLMASGQWFTLHSLAMSTGGSEAGCSARIRDMRKVRFGSHVVQRRRVDGGLFEYRCLMPQPCNCPVMK